MKVKKTQKKKHNNKNERIRKKQKTNHEIWGVIIFSFGVLMLLSFYFNNSIGPFGVFVKQVMLGIMGITAYLLPPLVAFFGIVVIFKKNIGKIKMRALYTIILLVLISSFIQTGFYRKADYEGLNALVSVQKFYKNGVNLSGGGLLGGIVSIPFLLLFKPLGTVIVLTTLSVIDIVLLTNVSIAAFICDIKSLLKSLFIKLKISYGNNLDNGQEKNIIFEEDLYEQNSNKLEVIARPKVINFELEKNTRTLNKSNTDIRDTLSSKKTDDEEAIDLVLKDIRESPAKGNSHNEKILEEQININEHNTYKYKYPPLRLLKYYSASGKNIRSFKAAAVEKARKLEETLSSFGVDAKVINISRGPTVTRYELQPSTGVKVSKIVNLTDDISLNLATSGVRIEAPIPGKAAIGIEVPNDDVATVSLREIIESSEFKNSSSKVSFAMGKNISGHCIVADVGKMPHLLIAGATGSGKSVCINSLIVSLVYKASPDEVKLLMIDPKVVELGIYNGIPHLLIPVVTEPKKAAGALNWAVQEMVNRYKLFAEKGVRDITGYNENLKNNSEEGIMPQIVIIIDELADLMMVAPNDVEDAVCRLAQMARAAGMHLVIATQRPSVNVITGVIKANIPSRISFSVSSQVDSRTILDTGGAEKLLGKGDMLFYPVGTQKPTRIQGAFVSDSEIEDIVEFLKEQGSADYNDDIIEEINSENASVEEASDDCDEMLPKAIEMVVEAGQASVSLIQRKFKVGYARAARIIDQMEERGIVGGFEGSKPRQVLITKQQLQELRYRNEE